MLVLTPKYGSQIDIDLLKKQKDKSKEPLIKHRNDIIYLTHCKNINEAYLTFLDNKGKYFISYKPKNADEIHRFVRLLGKIDTLDVSWIDVSELDRLEACFLGCIHKHIVGLNKWDVSNVKDMRCMFFDCQKLESINDISGWDVSNVKYMNHMFCFCENLESIDLSRWDVNKVFDVRGMFSHCENLESIGDISGWDVSTTAWLDEMFNACKKLKRVGDLERWNVPINVDTYKTFNNCAIKPIPSWYTKK